MCSRSRGSTGSRPRSSRTGTPPRRCCSTFGPGSTATRSTSKRWTIGATASSVGCCSTSSTRYAWCTSAASGLSSSPWSSPASTTTTPSSRVQPADSGHLVLAVFLLLQTGSAATPAHGPGVGLPRSAAFDAAAFDPLVLDGIRQGGYPGAALVIGRRDTILFAKGYGHLTWSSLSPAVTVDSTLYDLASLTKVIATTPALMILVERGTVRLDAPVATYIRQPDG